MLIIYKKSINLRKKVNITLEVERNQEQIQRKETRSFLTSCSLKRHQMILNNQTQSTALKQLPVEVRILSAAELFEES